MKKLLALLLAVVMVLGMVACAAKTEAPKAEAPKAEEPKAEEKKEEPKAEEKKEEAPAAEAPKEIVQVDYYCNIGAYLITLQKEIDKWNEGEGKEKGVYLNLISNINTYSQDLEAFLTAGTYFDLMDASTQTWIEKGWIKNLREIGAEYPEFQAMIDGYEPYINGAHEKIGCLCGLPLEVVPIKMAVNTDLFEKNGLELPKTWEDIYNAAKVITENGNGEEFGYGWSNWSACYRRLTFKACMASTEKGWWDPNTATYNFAQYEIPMNYLKAMYENGYMIGADDLAIDPIRAEFAKGVVGMFPAPSYDYAVYTEQFPAECNWTVIDMPAITEGADQYKGVFLDRVGAGVCKPAWDAADQAKKDAIVECLLFLNSDYLNGTIYEMGGMIPYKPEVIANAKVSDTMGPQWELFADLTNYVGMFQYPDSAIVLEGDNYATVCASYMHGDLGDDWGAVAADLEERYNATYADLKASGATDVSAYEAPYNHSK